MRPALSEETPSRRRRFSGRVGAFTWDASQFSARGRQGVPSRLSHANYSSFLFVSGAYGVLLRNERYLGWELGSGFPSIKVAHASSLTLAPGKSTEAPPWASVSLFLKRGVGL